MTYSLAITAVPKISYAQIIALFSQYQSQAWSFLLDSCEHSQHEARFNIIAFSPLLTFEYKSGKQSLGGDWAKKMLASVDSSSPYETLANIHKAFSNCIDLSLLDTHRQFDDLPFLVGALSSFGYDLNHHSDQIKDEQPNQYDLPDISAGFFGQSIIYDKHKQSAYICSIEPDKGSAILQQLKQIQASTAAIPKASPFALQSDWQSNMTAAYYAQQMKKISEYLRAGDCYQVNFAQRFEATYTGCEWSAYRALSETNQGPFSAFVRLPTSVILSVSPERFLFVKNGQAETKPIKGTRKRSGASEQDAKLAEELLNSAKDRAENLMIVDLLRNDLSKHCQSHSVKVPKLFALESYPAVHHMVSTVVGTLKPDSTPYHLLEGAFPGGSITGAPKVRAMQIIQELEPDKRSIYCGSIGYVGIRNDMDTNICIRTVLAERGKLYCWAGGGIVIDSNNADEYQESFDKVAKILPTLLNFSQSELVESEHD